MSQADDLMREAHGLAETIRRSRAIPPRQRERDDDGVAVMEAQLAKLWGDIRAARVGGPEAGLMPQPVRRTRPKWE